MSSEGFGGLAGDDERAALEAIQVECYGARPEGIARGTERTGLDQVRVVRDEGRVVGGLWRIPMAQTFGGRAVPTVGIGAVGVATAHRGRGAAGALMAGTVRELAADGVALSTLFPATVPLYRSAGYELAGGHHRIELASGGLGLRDEGPPLRTASEDDRPAMEACAREYALLHPGHLVRGPYCNGRIWDQGEDKTVHAVLVEEDGQVTGHLVWVAAAGERGSHQYRMAVLDLAALTAAAGRRLLTALASQASIVSTITLYAAPQLALWSLLPEWRPDERLHMPWMLRVTDLRAALTARGWPVGVDVELHLRVDDPLVPANDGAWCLRVRDGRATVEPGGRGDLRLSERGLAALYSGWQSPDQLVLAGLAEGPPDQRALAAAAFAGPPPSMIDMF